jgi:3-dehydroquinate synthase
MELVEVRLPTSEISYEIRIGVGLLSGIGAHLRSVLQPNARRIALISNRRVFGLFGQTVSRSLRKDQFSVQTWLMKEGERHKSLNSYGGALRFLNESKIGRADVVVALGGGVVGDLAGFAAATYLRGIDFIQIPTTLLAQIDASVGGKTGLNLPNGKNLVGAFYQPRLVLIDVDTLQTLPRRELTAGWCEAIKHGAVGDRDLFDRTTRLLRRGRNSRDWAGDSQAEICATIARHCRFKAEIVAGDARESIDRQDNRSRRILNFGHTTAHALEAVTNYRRFRHGEAVGYGMLVAGELSKNLGMLAPEELELLRAAVAQCGPLPPAEDLNPGPLLRAMQSDKKSVAGDLKWVLLEKIGTARLRNGSQLNQKSLRAALRAGLKSLANKSPKPT